MGSVILVVAFLGFPAVARWGAHRSKALEFLGPIVLCYLFGIALGNVFSIDTDLATTFTEATVVLAIPLLLFTTDFRAWLRIARPAVVSFALATIAVVITSTVATLVLSVAHDWQMAGMTVGVYTGGTPNMSAVGLALDVPDETFVLMNGADVILSGLYLLFLLSIAQRVLGRFLPAFDLSRFGSDTIDDSEVTPGFRGVVLALALSVGASAVAVGIVYLFAPDLPIAAVILSITTVGVLASFVQRIRTLPGTFETGDFLLLIFAAVVLGGTSLMGGRGTIAGTLIGAFVIGVLADGLVLLGVSEFWQMVTKGLVIILAVILDQFQKRST